MHGAHVGEMRISYKILIGKPEGKMPLGRPYIELMILKFILKIMAVRCELD